MEEQFLVSPITVEGARLFCETPGTIGNHIFDEVKRVNRALADLTSRRVGTITWM